MTRSAPLRRSTGDVRLTVPVFRPRRCKSCREQFTPTKQMQAVCGIACAIDHGKKEAAKVDRKATREKLQAIKTRGQWMKEAQAAFNAYIRARDEAMKLPCISCGRHHSGAWDAGHYLTVGARPELRFDETNVHRQCVPCNQHLHGNLVLYRIGLVRRIGLSAVERLEGPGEPMKLTIPELQSLKSTYAAKARALRKAAT